MTATVYFMSTELFGAAEKRRDLADTADAARADMGRLGRSAIATCDPAASAQSIMVCCIL